YLHENAADVAAMVDLARQTAYEMGMQPYYLYRQKHMAGNLENVGYAKPGDACLYNVAMMDEMMDVLALGVGAVSKRIVGSQILRRPNPRDIALYIRRIEEICEQKSAFFHG
ncbi:MAG: coproporphyrinogen dehydrogenase HemZ, partial [Acutalibacteraceae bacterium]